MVTKFLKNTRKWGKIEKLCFDRFGKKLSEKRLTQDISHLSKSCKCHFYSHSPMPWQSVACQCQPAQESYATKIYITKKDFYHFLGVFKHCPRAASVTCIPALMPWQQSEACQLWSLLSSGELCHIETSGDGGSHQDHIMTVCQITPTSLIMVWSQLKQYSMYCAALCSLCVAYLASM